jgi:NCS2 family nucleobase:cation symporter-2
MALAPILGKMRKVFPTFIVGLVVAMVGVSVIKVSVASLFGIAFQGDAIRTTDIIIGMFSLMVMVL